MEEEAEKRCAHSRLVTDCGHDHGLHYGEEVGARGAVVVGGEPSVGGREEEEEEGQRSQHLGGRSHGGSERRVLMAQRGRVCGTKLQKQR